MVAGPCQDLRPFDGYFFFLLRQTEHVTARDMPSDRQKKRMAIFVCVLICTRYKGFLVTRFYDGYQIGKQTVTMEILGTFIFYF